MSEEPCRDACLLCGDVPQQFLFLFEGVAFKRCHRCGLVYARNLGWENSQSYGGEYYQSHHAHSGYSDYIARSRLNRLTFHRRLATLERKLGGKGALLDVGCALGDLLVVARDRGWMAVGLDISEYATTYAHIQYGVTAFTGTLADGHFPIAAFRAITMYDVLEHLPDPIADLERAYRLLEPGGVLDVVTPNVASLSARLLGRRWYHYKPREHLCYFSPQTLTKALQLAGFYVSEVRWARSVVTLAFISEALSHYVGRAALQIGRLLSRLSIGDLPFPFYLGEIEAWAWKR